MSDTTDFLNISKQDELLKEMLDVARNDIDKREGSIMFDALSPTSFMFFKQSSLFKDIMEQAFACRGKGIYLDYSADDVGLVRMSATPSRVMLEIKGVDDTVIPNGTRFGIVDSDLIFVTREQVVIKDGIARVSAVCTTKGSRTNVDRNSITLLLDPMSGIQSVTNPEYADYGVDDESDDDFRERILYQKRNSENDGLDSDYERWALSVTGVNYAKSLDKPRGIGTVDVIIGGNETVEGELVKSVQTLIDKKKQPGIDVVVRKVKSQVVNITVYVEGLDESEAIKAIRKYTNTIGVGGTVVVSKITWALLEGGASDVKVIQPKNNVKIEDDSLCEVKVTISNEQ